MIEQAETLGEPPDDPLLLFSVLYGFWVASIVAFDGDVTRELAAEFLALAEKQRAIVPLMIGHRALATSLLCTGDITEGREHYNQALELFDPAAHRGLATRFGQDVGVTILSWRPLALWLLGYPEAALADDASRCIGEAMTLVETTKETWFEAEVHRIAGEIALKSLQPDAAKAEAYFERSLSVAREQKAKSWELRAAMSLARLWRDQGKVQQARELLTPVYDWFTEGFDTRDLQEAKKLLDELHA